MDLKKLTLGEKIIGASTIAFLIFMFLPWFGKSVSLGAAFGGVTASKNFNGWHYFLFGIIPLLLALVMCAQIAITRFAPDTKLPELPLAWGMVHLILGGLAALLVLLKLAIGDTYSSVDLDRKFGVFLALLAAIGLAVGAFYKYREEPSTTTGTVGPGTTPPTPF